MKCRSRIESGVDGLDEVPSLRFVLPLLNVNVLDSKCVYGFDKPLVLCLNVAQ